MSQDFPRDKFEMIYVEQRGRSAADAYNHGQGLPSLWDRYESLKDEVNLRVLYLDDPPEVPYHLGRANNRALEVAQGEVISVMDGDLLLPSDFLTRLTEIHRDGVAVVNLVRRMCQYPVGVRNFSAWKEAEIEFHRCLRACYGRHARLPSKVGNMGPMISARREYWESIGGYDPSEIWSTTASTSGSDVTRRLELVTNTEAFALPHVFAVHPWHPSGVLRAARRDRASLVRQYFALQKLLTDWSVTERRAHWRPRQFLAHQFWLENLQLIDLVLEEERLDLEVGSELDNSLDRSTILLQQKVDLRNALGWLKSIWQ